MIEEGVNLIRSYPQIAVFLSIAIGYYVGKLRFFGFSLGSTASVLLAALVVGQLKIDVPNLLKNVSFALFIFTIGYKVGPQFFGSLKKEGIKYVLLSVFFAIVALVTAVLLVNSFGFDKGTAAGVLGGALTQSSVIGTADGAIGHLAESVAHQKILESHVAVAYAITYLFGTAGLIVFFKFLPRIIGIDLKKEAAILEQEMSEGQELPPELFTWSKRLDLRSYEVTDPKHIGKTVDQVEASFSNEIDIDKIKRNGELIDVKPETVLQSGDLIAVIANSERLMDHPFGTEIYDADLHQQMGEIIDICILNKEVVGGTLGELSKKLGVGIFVRQVTRQGHPLPLVHNTIIHKCDLIEVTGPKDVVESAIKYLGYPERKVTTTDLVLVGVGCILGTLLGLLSVKVAEIPITLGVGGGVLVAGLMGGYLRSLHPTFGQIPNPAQWIFTDLGLNLFIACVGLIAGPKAIDALKQMGISIFFAGVILTLTPHILSVLFGRFVLKMNYVLLLGALTGAGTITAALNALKEESNSSTPILGYTVPYAIGNVLLTVWGTMIVYLVK